jgi:uncharacterized membrane protein YgdD (TMEM256/DUF423 family)
MATATVDGWLAVAAVNGLIAVGAGAWAAHGLEAAQGAQAAEWARTASTYQMWHALALLALWAGGWRSRGRWLFLAGIVLFSGSLYALALGGPRGLVYATPFGGLAFLLGWVWLVARALGLRPRRR